MKALFSLVMTIRFRKILLGHSRIISLSLMLFYLINVFLLLRRFESLFFITCTLHVYFSLVAMTLKVVFSLRIF